MRFAAILAALAVAATAAPTSSSAFDGAGPALAARDACKDIDGYEECVNNCSSLEPGFACTIACLISQCA
ncbi:hypothetical protein LQW54_011593 [Pestalotiopsis sp. IQ-011]